MSIHEHLPPQARKDLKEVGWTKGLELAKIARRDGQHFDCATWLHKARELPREDFRRAVEFLPREQQQVSSKTFVKGHRDLPPRQNSSPTARSGTLRAGYIQGSTALLDMLGAMPVMEEPLSEGSIISSKKSEFESCDCLWDVENKTGTASIVQPILVAQAFGSVSCSIQEPITTMKVVVAAARLGQTPNTDGGWKALLTR